MDADWRHMCDMGEQWSSCVIMGEPRHIYNFLSTVSVLSEGVLLCQSRSYLCSEVLLCDVVLFLYLLVCMMMVVVE